MKRRVLLGFSFAAVLLALLISFVGSGDIIDEIAGADTRVLGLGVVSGLLALTFRGFVWIRFINLIDETMTRRRTGGIFLTAMFIKYVTPYGQVATEPFVAYLLSRDGEMAYEDGLAGVLSADLLNYVPYYTFGFLALVWIALIDIPGRDLGNPLVAFGGLFVVIITITFIVIRRRELVYRTVLGLTGLLRRALTRVSDRFDDALSPAAVRSRLDGFYRSVETITTDTKSLVLATVYAHLGMAFLMLPVYLGASALGYQLAFSVVALTVALGKLGSVVPAPGGTGGVEAFVMASLTTLGSLDGAAALTVALIYRICTYWLTVGVGGFAAFVLVFRK